MTERTEGTAKARTPTRFPGYSKAVIPVAFLQAASLVFGLGIVAVTLPNGDVERYLFRDVPEGVQVAVEHLDARTNVRNLERRLLPRGRYGWHIDEERRTVILAASGSTPGLVRRAYVLSAWIDATPDPLVAPHPKEAFRFYAPTRKDAERLRDRLGKSLAN